MPMMPTRRSRHTLRAALAWLLSLMLAAGPAFAQILPPPDNDPPPMEEPDDDDDDSNGGGPFDSLDSGDSFNSDDSDSGDSDSDDSDELEAALLIAGLVTLVVVLAANSSNEDRRASHTAAEAMAGLRKVEDVLEESASRQSPLTVVDQRPADSRERFLTPDQRQQAMIVTASTPAGEQLALTVDREAAELAADGPLFVQSLEAGWQVTGGGGVLSFVPNSQLVKLTGHRPLKNVAVAGVQSDPAKP